MEDDCDRKCMIDFIMYLMNPCQFCYDAGIATGLFVLYMLLIIVSPIIISFYAIGKIFKFIKEMTLCCRSQESSTQVNINMEIYTDLSTYQPNNNQQNPLTSVELEL